MTRDIIDVLLVDGRGYGLNPDRRGYGYGYGYGHGYGDGHGYGHGDGDGYGYGYGYGSGRGKGCLDDIPQEFQELRGWR